MGLANSLDDTSNAVPGISTEEFDLSLDDIDDEELEAYIMSEHEFQCKSGLWHKCNAAYLEEQKGMFFINVPYGRTETSKVSFGRLLPEWRNML